jgi:hypothetical protein
MHGFLASVRYSLRLLLKSPGFTITAILILGFGIGANTAVFSLIDSVLLTPPPYPEPERMTNISMFGRIYRVLVTRPARYPDQPSHGAARIRKIAPQRHKGHEEQSPNEHDS